MSDYDVALIKQPTSIGEFTRQYQEAGSKATKARQHSRSVLLSQGCQTGTKLNCVMGIYVCSADWYDCSCLQIVAALCSIQLPCEDCTVQCYVIMLSADSLGSATFLLASLRHMYT